VIWITRFVRLPDFPAGEADALAIGSASFWGAFWFADDYATRAPWASAPASGIGSGEMRLHRDDRGGRPLLAYGLALAFGAASAALALAWLDSGTAHAGTSETAAVSTAPAAYEGDGTVFGPPRPPDYLDVVRGELRAGETLHSTLTRMGVPGATVHEIAIEMRPVFDFRFARPGDRFRLARKPGGEVIDFEYRTSAIEGYRLYRVGEELVATAMSVDLVARTETLVGVVTNSVYNAIRNLGESGQLAHDFSELFAWEVDFSREVQPGDEFRIRYERVYQRDGDGNEVYVRPGRILAAQYRGADETTTAILYEREDGTSGYYRPDGTAIERQFLRAPLKYTRVTSPFSWSRLHPILRVRRPHLGIDYGAPYGTPVWSIADGKVERVQRMGGMGKTVRVRHANGYVSTYGHLQRYAQGLKVGDRVKRKEVIGYVGSTGLATGPHVHYDLRKDGKSVNPNKVQTPPAPPIPSSELAAFQLARDATLAELDPTPIASLGEAL
jgi:murein DD-endopeptidase MepM/ murein hydrolase activator NlpD